MNDVHPEAHVAARPPREAHRLTATVVEELDVSAAKVSVCHAVEDVVEAGFRQGEPGQVVEHAGTDRLEGVHADRQAERQPEHDEHQAATHIRLSELVVRRGGGRQLIRAPGGTSHAYHQLHEQEDRHQGGQPDQQARTHRLLHRDAAEPATTEVRTHVQERLQGHCDHGNHPLGDNRGCYMTRCQAGVPVEFRCTVVNVDKGVGEITWAGGRYFS